MVSNALSQYGCDLKGKKNCFINLIHRSEKWGLYPLAVTHLRSQSYFIRVRIISQVNSHLWVNVPFTKTQPLILIENRVILVYSFSDFSKEKIKWWLPGARGGGNRVMEVKGKQEGRRQGTDFTRMTHSLWT